MSKQRTIRKILARDTFGICLSLSLFFSAVSPGFTAPSDKPDTTSSDSVMSDSSDDGSVDPSLLVKPEAPSSGLRKTRAQIKAEEEQVAADAEKAATIETNHALEHLNLSQHYEHRLDFQNGRIRTRNDPHVRARNEKCSSRLLSRLAAMRTPHALFSRIHDGR